MTRFESLSGSRRSFLKSLAIGSAAGYAWLRGSDVRAAMDWNQKGILISGEDSDGHWANPPRPETE